MIGNQSCSLLKSWSKKYKNHKKCDLPILVESTFAFNIDMLSPNCFQGSQTTWGFNVANHSNTHHRWSLKNGNSFDNLASTAFTSRTINLTNNMRHTSFKAQKGRQMAWFLSIILREGLHLTTMALGTFFGIESHGSMARCRKLTMRHVEASRKRKGSSPM